MTAPRTPQWPPPARQYVIALGLIAAVMAVSYFAFKPGVPFMSGYRVQAVFESSNGLRGGSPVRIAGADVGEVVEVERGPGHTTLVTLELEDAARPVHSDATARIRPRVFLEGGYLVELSPGSPSAPELPDDGTIGLSQTAIPVQFHQFLTVFDSEGRESLSTSLDTIARALERGGARGLRTLAPELEPLLRDLAWLGEAGQGERPDDLSRLIAATDEVATALDSGPGRAGDLVAELATVAETLRSRDAQLAATIGELGRLLERTPGAMRALDAALPSVERAAGALAPALAVAPERLGEIATILRELGLLVAPGRREATIAALETAFLDLPAMVSRLAEVFPATRPLADCLSSHVVPVLRTEVPDGELSSGGPVWQDFAHALVGLSSASQNFDGHGHNLRYQFGIGDQTLSTAVVPGFGTLLANAPSTLQSRPLPRPDGEAPPFVADAPCSEQPLPVLETPAGPAGLSPARGAGPARTVSPERFSRLLAPKRLARILEASE